MSDEIIARIEAIEEELRKLKLKLKLKLSAAPSEGVNYALDQLEATLDIRLEKLANRVADLED